ncbi:MAG: glutamyl-tRNA reductase [Spirochaetaceae bacterium]|jgi:glutamyl-tRNA reductase|nr:glutamyl-tRNA reductase [Spirochaetaceae bacterium]
MDIRMAGIDYTRAGVGERERFAFTSSERAAALCCVVQRYAGTGCVIIATCNRTELWLCAGDGACPSPDRILSELKAVPYHECKNIFVSRDGRAAVEHLFYLAGGLKSQIRGENQILSQVKEALEAAREAGSAGLTLQRLFQSAIASAKRVRTETGIARADASAAQAALDFVRENGFDVRGAPCLVIGSGVIGRLCAELFSRSGAAVTMTRRRHRQDEGSAPSGIRVIDYEARYEVLADYRLVISATVSPHHTIAYVEAEKRLRDEKERVFLDLALPRDIEPAIKKIAGVKLFDIDEINGQCPERDCPADAEKIKKIIDEEMSSFNEWNAFRVNIETILAVRNEAAADMALRLKTLIRDCARDEMAAERLRAAVTQTAGKVIDKMLFGLRDNLDAAFWPECFEALRRASVVETRDKERA